MQFLLCDPKNQGTKEPPGTRFGGIRILLFGWLVLFLVFILEMVGLSSNTERKAEAHFEGPLKQDTPICP